MSVNKYLAILIVVFMLCGRSTAYGYIAPGKLSLGCMACVLATFLCFSCCRCGKECAKENISTRKKVQDNDGDRLNAVVE